MRASHLGGLVWPVVCVSKLWRCSRGLYPQLQLPGSIPGRPCTLQVDVLVENFRPGVMEEWGLGPRVSRPAQAGEAQAPRGLSAATRLCSGSTPDECEASPCLCRT